MTRRYFTTTGMRSSGSSTGSSSTTSDTDELTKTVSTMQIELSSVSNTVNGLSTLSSKITSVTNRVSALESSEYKVYNYYDSSADPNALYSTDYINNTLTNIQPTVYDDLSMTSLTKTSPAKLVSGACVAAISNINYIPSVYSDLTLSAQEMNYPKVLSASAVITELAKIPTIKSTTQSNVTPISADTNAYCCSYINNLAIPTMIYSETDSAPITNAVYSAEYINTLAKGISTVYADMNRNSIVKSYPEVYSCDVIDSLAIPNDILNDLDEHVTTSVVEDTTLTNVYNTYFMDQWVGIDDKANVNGNTYTATTLSMRLFKGYMRQPVLEKNSTSDYYQYFGSDSQEYRWQMNDRRLYLYWTAESVNNELSDVCTLMKNSYVPLWHQSTGSEYGGIIESARVAVGFNYIDSLTSDYVKPESYSLLDHSRLQVLTDIRDLTDEIFTDSIIHGFYNGGPLAYSYNKIIKDSSHTEVVYGFNEDPNGDIWSMRDDKVSVYRDLYGTCNNYFGTDKSINEHTFTGSVTFTSPDVAIGDSSDDSLTVNSESTFKSDVNVQSNLLVTDGTDGVIIKGSSDGFSLTSTADDGASIVCDQDSFTINRETVVDKNLIVKGIITQSSDRRLKSNISEMTSDSVSSMTPVTFTMNNDPSQLRYGFIAQDLQKQTPELVSSDSDGLLSVNYMDIIAHLVNHIQKQDARIDALEELVKGIR